MSKTVPTAKQDVPTDRPAAQAAAKSEEPAAREPSVTTQFFRSLRREIWMLDVQIGMALARLAGWIHEPVKPAEQAGDPQAPGWLSAQDKKGSTPESEAAVERALRWLTEHQYPDGSWNFEHRLGPCQNRCDHPGILKDAAMGATGLAVLAFVSHGNTHQTGPYSKQVASGLAYLIRHMAADGGCADGGRMYSHAISALAFCEDCRIYQETFGPMVPVKTRGPTVPSGAAGDKPIVSNSSDPRTPRQKRQEQTRNAAVWNAANKAIAYTLSCQDPRLGGWRYDRRPDSDISVTGWQTMGLDSAMKQRITVPPATYQGISRFLDLMQQMQGATYGYHPLEPQVTPTRSAVGLLCRMYTGWPQSNPALAKGVELLALQGPSEDDMYYNYYATLVLHHWGTELWEKWNERLRDFLVHVQARGGHQDGSWYLPANRVAHLAGGRHLDTCLACLVLEVYYRSKSVYGQQRSPGDLLQDERAAKP